MRKIAFALLYVFLIAMPAYAQSWPTQPIKIVVGFPPGGMADALPRKMQDPLAAAHGTAGHCRKQAWRRRLDCRARSHQVEGQPHLWHPHAAERGASALDPNAT